MADLAQLNVVVTKKGIIITNKALQDLTKSALGAEGASQKLENRLDKIAKMSSKFKTFGRDINRFVGLPLTVAGAAAVKFALDLNKGLGNVQTLIPNTGARINDLKEIVKDVGIESGKSFNDLNAGLYRTISVFQDGVDTADRFRTAVKAGIAGYGTTADAVQLLSAVTRAYGDTTADAVQKVSDLSFKAIQLGDTTLPALSAGMQVATDRAVRLGISQKELFASMATLTGITGDASMVATQFRSAMDSLLNPTDTMTQLFKELGVTSGEALVEQYGLADSMKVIVSSAKASGIAIQDLITRKEGITFAARIAGEQFDDFNWKLGEMNESLGSTDAAFSAATEGVNKFGFALDQNKMEIAGAATVIGDKLLPYLADLTGRVADTLTGMSNLPPIMQYLGVAGGVAAASVGTLTIAFGALINATKIFTATKIGAFFTGPVGITAGIALLVGQFILATKAAKDFEKALDFDKKVDNLANSFDDAEKSINDYAEGGRTTLGVAEELIEIYPQLAEEVDKYTVSQKNLYTALQNVQRLEVADKFADEVKELDDIFAESQIYANTSSQFEALSKSYNKGLIDYRTFRKSIKSLVRGTDIETDIYEAFKGGSESASLIAVNNLIDQQTHAYDKYKTEAEKGLAGLNATVAQFGVKFVNTFDGIIATTIDSTLKTTDEATNDVVDTLGKTGDKAGKGWQDFFAQITGVSTSRFDNAKGDYFSRSGAFDDWVSDLETGMKASIATLSDIDISSLSEGGIMGNISEMLLTGTDNLGSTKDKINDQIIQLLSIPPEVIEEGFGLKKGFWEDTLMPSIIERMEGVRDTYATAFEQSQIADVFKEMGEAMSDVDFEEAMGITDMGSALDDKLSIAEDAMIDLRKLGVDPMSDAFKRVSREVHSAREAVADFNLEADNTSPYERAIESMNSYTEAQERNRQNGFFEYFNEQLGMNAKASAIFTNSVMELQDSLRDGLADALVSVGTNLGQVLYQQQVLGEDGVTAYDALRLAARDYALSIAEMIPQLLQAAGLEAIKQGQWGLGLGLIAAAGVAGVGSGYASAAASGDTIASAQGNVFGNTGHLSAFATGGAFTNSIVSSPTYFPFANGTGLMGEDGPEAILPLTRTASGNLGVEAVGAGGSGAIVNVHNYSSEKAEVSTSTGSDGKEIVNIVIGTVKKEFNNGGMDAIMSTRYGATKQGRSA